MDVLNAGVSFFVLQQHRDFHIFVLLLFHMLSYFYKTFPGVLKNAFLFFFWKLHSNKLGIFANIPFGPLMMPE